MSVLLVVLAIAGFLALVHRLGRSLLRLGLNLAEGTAASGLAEVSARRGDLTGFMERRADHHAIRRARIGAAAAASVYFLLLAVPLFAGLGREVYAASALLWLLPTRAIRPRTLPPAPRQP